MKFDSKTISQALTLASSALTLASASGKLKALDLNKVAGLAPVMTGVGEILIAFGDAADPTTATTIDDAAGKMSMSLQTIGAKLLEAQKRAEAQQALIAPAKPADASPVIEGDKNEF